MASAPSRAATWARFLIPSVVGVAFLLVPLRYDGRISILLGHLVDGVRASTGNVLPALVTAIVVLSALTSLATRGLPALDGTILSGPWASILRPSWPGVVVRIAGALICVMVWRQVGPEWLIGAATGQVIVNDLLSIIFVVFLAAAFLLPCLTDFGLMEWVGGIAAPIFRPLFGLPGRSAVDAAASWLGAAPVGVLITADQYQRGFYTEREAVVIATNFSVVSIAFAYVIIDFVGLGSHFVPFYSTIIVCGLVAALVCPLLPPLRAKPDTYVDGTRRLAGRRARSGASDQDAVGPLEAALARAAQAPHWTVVLRRAVRMVVDIWFGLLPAVAVIGTLAIALAEFTPTFQLLGAPFLPLLRLLQIPEAAAAAPAMVVGFADQFLPVVLARPLESAQTRFVVACVCVNQLIYMSEVGVLLLRSAIPVRLLDLVSIFLVRTILTLPIAALAARLLI